MFKIRYRTACTIGIVIGGLGLLGAAQVALSFAALDRVDKSTGAGNLDPADKAMAAKNLARCERELHAAHSQGYTWTFLPLGHDRHGDVAIKVRGILAHDPEWYYESEILNLVRDTECYASKGEWWERPINIIADIGSLDNVTIGSYDGHKVTPCVDAWKC
jgi:hypothetical protein